MRANLWTIVLAAGSGRRLAKVTGGVPKQFWKAGDNRTLLENTLIRIAPLSPPDRTVIVVDQTHAPLVRAVPTLAGFSGVLYQPRDRGTAPGVLLALSEIAAQDPDAAVLLTPSDHAIANPRRFVAGIRAAVAAVRRDPAEIVLFGVTPSAPDGDFGWITPTAEATSPRLRRVGAFVEKPPLEVARQLFAANGVWNTMVLVARAGTLLGLYEKHLPGLSRVFAHARRLARDARFVYLAAAYEQFEPADFSRDLLGGARGLALHTWPLSMGWSDLGTPDRLAAWREDCRRLRGSRSAPRDSGATDQTQVEHGHRVEFTALSGA